jgi:phosphatidylglycerophosphate synthase
MPDPAQPIPDSRLTSELEAFSRTHAALLGLGTFVTAFLGAAWPPTALGFGSFLGLFWRARGRFTSSSRFGPANAVTFLRLLLVLALGGALGPRPLPQCAVLAGLTLLLDGVDGFVARKTRSASVFGAYFDMETDAFFVLVTSVVLWTRGRLGLWILCGGLLRPAYVLWLWALPATRGEEPRSNWGRLAFLGFAMGLIAPLASNSAWADALAVLGTACVSLSFARSGRYWYLARAQARSGKAPGSSGKTPGA